MRLEHKYATGIGTQTRHALEKPHPHIRRATDKSPAGCDSTVAPILRPRIVRGVTGYGACDRRIGCHLQDARICYSTIPWLSGKLTLALGAEPALHVFLEI